MTRVFFCGYRVQFDLRLEPSGQNYLENNHLASLIIIHSVLINRTDGFPVIRTVRLMGVRLTGMEYKKFDIQTTGSPVNKKSS